MNAPATVSDVQEAVKALPVVKVRAGGSKPALSEGATLELSGLAGVLEYEPQEYTFSALAGTTLADVERLLAEHGQYLPFDPPLLKAGATLGGTVAAGLSGPGRQRYGGVRDFLLGVKFVSGGGQLLTGGGKVVKNAAGFDLPKLMVGSLGQFGVLAELSFKVFPRPEAFASLRVTLPDLDAAHAAMLELARSPFELHGLELLPPSTLLLRLGGRAEALDERLKRLQALLGSEGEPLTGEAETRLWQDAREFAWSPAGHALVKVALNPTKVPALEQALTRLAHAVPRRYSAGGHALYLAWAETAGTDSLLALLSAFALSGLALTGSWRLALLGRQAGGAFLRRVRSALDPEGKFAPAGALHAA